MIAYNTQHENSAGHNAVQPIPPWQSRYGAAMRFALRHAATDLVERGERPPTAVQQLGYLRRRQHDIDLPQRWGAFHPMPRHATPRQSVKAQAGCIKPTVIRL